MKKKIIWSFIIVILILCILIFVWLRNHALDCDREYNLCTKDNNEEFCTICELPLTNLINSYNKIRLEYEYTSCEKEERECFSHLSSCSYCLCMTCHKYLNKIWDYHY